jgi:hypothetical protein
MGKRRTRAQRAIDAVQERASAAAETLSDEGAVRKRRAARRLRKSRKSVDKTAREAGKKLGHRWNRGRFRVRSVRRKAERRIDRAVNKAR